MPRKGPRPEVAAMHKKVEKKVDAYIKSKEVKDDTGKVIDNPVLVVAPETLMDFFVSGVLSDLNKEERYYAKIYFKSKLPFKEYRESRAKNKDLRIEDIIHFKELQEGGRS